MSMNLSILAKLEIVISSTSVAVIDEIFVSVWSFPFHVDTFFARNMYIYIYLYIYIYMSFTSIYHTKMHSKQNFNPSIDR